MSETKLDPPLPPQERLLMEKFEALSAAIERAAIPRGAGMPWGDDPNPLLWVYNKIMPALGSADPTVVPVDPDKRQTLETMGQERVRRALANGELVMHLVQPAHAWLDEMDRKEKSDAVDQGQQQGSVQPEREGGSGSGQAPEAGGGNSVPGVGKRQRTASGDPA